MTQYTVISDPYEGGLRHGVYEVKGEGGSREVCRFYNGDEAAAYAGWRAQAEARAQSAREKVSTLRMPHDGDSPFESRRRGGESLNPPTTVAPVPITGDQCSECGHVILDTDSWQPDPDAETFTKIHRECLKRRAATH